MGTLAAGHLDEDALTGFCSPYFLFTAPLGPLLLHQPSRSCHVSLDPGGLARVVVQLPEALGLPARLSSWRGTSASRVSGGSVTWLV